MITVQAVRADGLLADDWVQQTLATAFRAKTWITLLFSNGTNF